MRSLMIGKRAGTLLCWLSTAPLVCEYTPLKIVARAGRHSELMQKALLKTTPSRPIRSMLGVFSRGLPARDDSSHRAPSPRKKTRLGLVLLAPPRAGLERSSCGTTIAAPAALAVRMNARRVCRFERLPSAVFILVFRGPANRLQL